MVVWEIRRWHVHKLVACPVTAVLRLGVWVTWLWPCPALTAAISADWAAGASVALGWLAGAMLTATISLVISGSVT